MCVRWGPHAWYMCGYPGTRMRSYFSPCTFLWIPQWQDFFAYFLLIFFFSPPPFFFNLGNSSGDLLYRKPWFDSPHPWRLRTTCNSSSRGPDKHALCPLRAPGTHKVQTHRVSLHGSRGILRQTPCLWARQASCCINKHSSALFSGIETPPWWSPSASFTVLSAHHVPGCWPCHVGSVLMLSITTESFSRSA